MGSSLAGLLGNAVAASVHAEGRILAAAELHAAAHPYPRFFLSPSYLAAYGDAFLVTEVGGCIVIAKRRQIMGNPAIYLIVPPQHLGGDPAAERAVIEQFRALGAGTMLDSYDIERYGYSLGDVGAAGLWGNEYVYDAATYANPAGADHKNTRAVLNRIRRSPEIDVADKVSAAELVTVARTWQQQTGRHASEAKIARQWHEHASQTPTPRHCSALYWYGKLAAYSLTEEVSPGRVVIVARLRDHSAGIPDPSLALHAMDAAHWGTGLMTIGAAGTSSLAAHKQKLRPVKVLAVHKLATTGKVSMDDYKAAKPCGATLF